MTRTTPPRPLDAEALFPGLAAHRGTTTRLHPRPGSPDASAGSVGGPLLWPADEPWPVCTEPHRHRSGRRPADIQVFRCSFDAHGENRTGMLLDLRRRRSWEVAGTLAEPARPEVVGHEGYVPEPCVPHPEQVVTYPFDGLLPEELCARIEAREEALEEAAEEAEPDGREWNRPPYRFDFSIPPGWRAGGYASWNLTDASDMDCAAPMDRGTVGRWGKLNVFACPADPGHPHRRSIQ